MQLTVLERVLVLNVLPKEGDLTTLRLVRKLQEALSFTEEEHALLKFQTDAEGLRWTPDVVAEREIEIGPKASEIVRKALEDLNTQKKLTAQFLELCDKFQVGVEG